MNKKIKILKSKFKKYNIDGYVVPKNDDYFTEYSKINRLKFISNFSGSAGIAVILKKKKLFIYRWKVYYPKSNRIWKRFQNY